MAAARASISASGSPLRCTLSTKRPSAATTAWRTSAPRSSSRKARAPSGPASGGATSRTVACAAMGTPAAVEPSDSRSGRRAAAKRDARAASPKAMIWQTSSRAVSSPGSLMRSFQKAK